MASAAARGTLLALTSASFFGLVNVVAKESALHPFALAAYTYLLAGLVLSPTLRGFRVEPSDRWRVGLMTLSGAFAAPALLYYGLRHANAADASLLLTMEMALTALLAALVLGERIRGRGALGLALLAAAALLVAGAGFFAPRLEGATTTLGILLVVGATLGWSVDNLASTHLTRRHDPRPLVALKGLFGGALGLLALLVVEPPGVPTLRNAAEVAFIGLFGIAASTVLFYRSLRLVGATRTTGVFVPTLALSGAVAGALILREPLGWPHLAAACLMVVGVVLLSGTAAGDAQAGPL